MPAEAFWTIVVILVIVLVLFTIGLVVLHRD